MRSTRFRRLSFLLFASLAFASNVLASERHSLWSVQGKHNTVYLLGSIHLLRADEPLPAAMEAAYGKAKTLIMEIDMDDLDPLAAQATTMELGLLPEGQTLEQQIGPQAAQKLATYAQNLGVDAAMLARFRPWLAAITLTQFQMMKLGLDSQAGIEQRFTAKAAADHKEIRGLETLQEQLNLFAQLSDRQQTQYLLSSIEDAEHADQELGQMLTAWRAGDADGLAKILNRGFSEFPELYARLTIDRNRRWLTPLANLLNEQEDYLVIVGALHLVGKDGLLDLLERRGYKIVQH